MTNSKFVIIEHHAIRARLHYDLRFKMPNSNNWASFAIRKGVPLKPGVKVLANKTHDHSEKEALFTGKIPEGEYGAGVLKKWDGGSCIIHKYKPAHITIEFKGRKVKGIYHLISLAVMRKPKQSAKQYFLFKGKTLNEAMGMISRIPSCGEVEETEEGSSEACGEKLPWSKRKSTV